MSALSDKVKAKLMTDTLLTFGTVKTNSDYPAEVNTYVDSTDNSDS